MNSNTLAPLFTFVVLEDPSKVDAGNFGSTSFSPGAINWTETQAWGGPSLAVKTPRGLGIGRVSAVGGYGTFMFLAMN